MKILILGHGGHGKGMVAQIINDLTGVTFCSSSVFAFDQCIWPVLGNEYVKAEPFGRVQEARVNCYEDRENKRQEWFDLIAKYCVPKDRLAKELLEKFDIYDGMRSFDEFETSKHLFDCLLWVDRSHHVALDPSMEIVDLDVLDCSITKNYYINNNCDIPTTTVQIAEFLRHATS